VLSQRTVLAGGKWTQMKQSRNRTARSVWSAWSLLPLSDCPTPDDSASKLDALQTLRAAVHPQEPSQLENGSTIAVDDAPLCRGAWGRNQTRSVQQHASQSCHSPSGRGENDSPLRANTERSAKGEGLEGLPGSESVARAEGGARNRGGPESPCRTNCEGQAGKATQRQEASPDTPGVGLARSIARQGTSPEAGEGANRSTQSAQATRAVRTTEQGWQTFLRVIAEKAFTNKHHRFGDL
jgi:hypothetical protein